MAAAVTSSRRLPLTDGQAGTLIAERLWGGSGQYVCILLATLAGEFDAGRVPVTLARLARRHQALRMRIVESDDGLCQEIAPPCPPEVRLVDLRGLAPSERVQRLAAIEAELAATRFRLDVPPLLRAVVARLDDHTHELIVAIHSIVFDRKSGEILLRELVRDIAGRPLPALRSSFAAYVDEQRRWSLRTDDPDAAWLRDCLHGVSGLHFVGSVRLPSAGFGAVGRTPISVGARDVRRLQALAADLGRTLFDIVLAAWHVVLARSSVEPDLAIATLADMRPGRGFEDVVGPLSNTLAIRVGANLEMPFRDLVSRAGERAAAAHAAAEYPFERLVADLEPARGVARMPVAQAMLVLTPASVTALDDASGLELADLRTRQVGSAYDLVLDLTLAGDELRGELIDASELHGEDLAPELAGRLSRVLERAAQAPSQIAARLDLLGAGERRTIIETWNATATAFDREACVHELFERQASATPASVALVFEDERVTYRELAQRSDRLADRLNELGVEPESVVGIALDRSPELVVAMLGALKAGGAFVLLDPAYPPARIAFMVDDADLSLVLVDPGSEIALPAGVRASTVAELTSAPAGAGEARRPARPDALAYVVYTSGTTGRPKGVALEHRGLSNLIEYEIGAFMSPGARVLQFASPSFDAAIFEIFPTICSGATLVLARRESLMPGPQLVDLLRSEAITNVTMAPSVLALLSPEDAPHLRVVVAAGEACTREVAARWAPGGRLHNGYGPSEVTVAATFEHVVKTDEPPPIGRPIQNVRVYLLDGELEPVPPGVAGELYVGGVGVGRGYLRRPGLTAERFLPDPFATQPGARMYRTGDRACYRRDGRIDFLGRIDDQLKVRGFRVEPAEIEAALDELPTVAASAVTLAGQALAAYVVPEPEAHIERRELLDHLRAQLPAYMIPAQVVVLDTLPRTPAGKLDRSALPSPQASRPERLFAARSPLESDLLRIWRDLLEAPALDVDDDFFEHGGHSLLGLRLVARVRAELGVDLPLSTLFHVSTVARMAMFLRTMQSPPRPSMLVPIRSGGTASPLFCLHALGGYVTIYAWLARALPEGRPIYGIEARGVDPGAEPHRSIEEMSDAYIELMERVHPDGPHLLCGFSMGGVIAYEMACRLEERGRPPAFLCMFDTIIHDRPAPIGPREALPLISLMTHLSPAPPDDAGPEEVLKAAIEQGRLPEDYTLRELMQLAGLFSINATALARYATRPYGGDLALFLTEGTPARVAQDWRRLVRGETKVIRAPGDHLDFIGSRSAVRLAETLAQLLEAVDAVPASVR